jgi:hypothetical protein
MRAIAQTLSGPARRLLAHPTVESNRMKTDAQVQQDVLAELKWGPSVNAAANWNCIIVSTSLRSAASLAPAQGDAHARHAPTETSAPATR